jgi:hypothetical protein
MAKSILSKTPPQKTRKTDPKMKKSDPAPTSIGSQKPEETFIPLYRSELFVLHDLAAGLKLLRDVAEEASEMQLIQVEIVIKKTERCAWNLIHEELDSRWQDLNPDVDLIRKD